MNPNTIPSASDSSPRSSAFFPDLSTMLSATPRPRQVNVITSGRIRKFPQCISVCASTKKGSQIPQPTSEPQIKPALQENVSFFFRSQRRTIRRGGDVAILFGSGSNGAHVAGRGSRREFHAGQIFQCDL